MVYDYRQSNPIFWMVISASGHVTRPCYFYLPADGDPTLLVHHVDAGKFTDSEVRVTIYSSRDFMLAALGRSLSGVSKVAMEHSPENSLPRVSRMDAGTIELVRSLGPEVFSSADLIQYATHQWAPKQLADHRVTATKFGRIVNEAFAYAREHILYGINEFQVAEFIRSQFSEEELASPDRPIVAVNANAPDPNYEPSADQYSAIEKGDWLLIDLWAKGTTPGSVYADIAWVAYVGDSVPARRQEIFDIVISARDAALSYLEDAHNQGTSVQGWQANQVARDFISGRGYGEYFTHRLGHSIGFEVHSEAVNLDGFETHDTRHIIPGICFSIEPGTTYQSSEFAPRSMYSYRLTALTQVPLSNTRLY